MPFTSSWPWSICASAFPRATPRQTRRIASFPSSPHCVSSSSVGFAGFQGFRRPLSASQCGSLPRDLPSVRDQPSLPRLRPKVFAGPTALRIFPQSFSNSATSSPVMPVAACICPDKQIIKLALPGAARKRWPSKKQHQKPRCVARYRQRYGTLGRLVANGGSMNNDTTIHLNAAQRLDRLPISSFHWRILRLIGYGMFLDAFDVYLAGGVLGALVKEGWSDLSSNGKFISATFAGMVIGAWLAGVLGDRYGRRFSYQFNLLVFGLASLAGAAAPSMGWLIAARFVMGIGLGAEI